MKHISPLFEGIFAQQSYDRTGYGSTPVQNPSPSSVGFASPPPGTLDVLNDPIKIADYKLRDWQQQIVHALERTTNIGKKKDIYILSQPGSGKTYPVIWYWINKIIGIDTEEKQLSPTTITNFEKLISKPQDIPKVLWLVPIKSLNANFEQEQTQRFTTIILQILNKTCTIDSTTGDIIFPKDPRQGLTLTFENIIKNFSEYGGRQLSEMILSSIQRDPNQDGRVPIQRVPEFKTSLGQLVVSYVRNALVGRKEEGVNTVKINKTDDAKPFVISIYESASGIIKDMNNLELLVFDEGQRLQGGKKDDNKRAAQIGDNIHEVLNNSNGENARIVMLSGSVNPITAANVMHYFNVAYGRSFDNMPHQTPATAVNPSNIRITSQSGLNDIHKQALIIKNHLVSGNKEGIVFVIFGKQRINDLIDMIAPSDRGYIDPRGKLAASKKGGIFDHKNDIRQITSPGSINDITDDRLRRAAGYGIGYLYRPEELTSSRIHDSLIVQNLFIARIIKVVLATDAIREGINITCDKMYIPSIINPVSREEADLGSLAQLINRTGRTSNKYAEIITDAKFVNQIEQSFSGDMSRFNEEPFVLPKSRIPRIGAGTSYIIGLGNGLLTVFFK